MKKRNNIFTIIFISVTFIVQSCSTKSNNDVKKIIDQQNQIYMDGYNNQNSQMAVDLHTDDVFVMPPNSKILRDKQAVKKLIEDDIQNGVHDVVFTTLDLKVDGDYAYEVGISTMKIGATIDTGKYIVVWEKQKNGDWLIKADIWNTDLPK